MPDPGELISEELCADIFPVRPAWGSPSRTPVGEDSERSLASILTAQHLVGKAGTSRWRFDERAVSGGEVRWWPHRCFRHHQAMLRKMQGHPMCVLRVLGM